ncbi:MAG: FG-GAP-like repeat-containing protein, partial [Hyphomicrobiaceae bacterium]|nr:FG-GAP-like repeat-containing protein [Hyphomicrobiaceae bacterium]
VGSEFADVLTGDTGANRLEGRGGKDRLDGGAGADVLDGGAGDDILDGGAGADILDGGTGNDRYVLAAGSGADTIVDASGVDRIVIGGTALPSVAVSGTNTIFSLNAQDSLTTATGTIEEVETSDGQVFRTAIGGIANDTITGTTGNDWIAGLAGNDRLIGGAGNDVLDGGDGTDTADYGSATQAVDVNLATGRALDGLGGTDTLRSIENVVGSEFADVLTGDAGANQLVGGGGNDYLDGGVGADVLDGGEGIDRAIYTASTAGVRVDLSTGRGVGGEAEGDTLVSIENVSGSQFIDVITGDAGANALYGLGGNDQLVGGGGNDYLDGGVGADVLDGGTGNDRYVLAAGGGADTIVDASGVDRIVIGSTALPSVAVSGTNTIFSLNAQDSLTTVTGTIEEVETSDGQVYRTAIGGTANDTLTGAAGNDWLAGLSGNDRLIGGAGNDVLDGGEGTDTADYGSATQAVDVNLATGRALDGQGGTDVLRSIETVIGSAQGDTLVGDAGLHRLEGGAGDDRLDGGAGADTLDGGAGNDRYVLASGGGADTIIDASGIDRIVMVGGTLASNITVSTSGSTTTFALNAQDSLTAASGTIEQIETGDGQVFGLIVGTQALAQPLSFGAPIAANTGFVTAATWTSQNLYPRTLADVNGDGRADIIGFASNGVHVALGQTNGTFGTAALTIANYGTGVGGWSSFDLYPRHVADVNGDGRADIVGFASGSVAVSLGQSNGTFGAAFTGTTQFGVSTGWSSFAGLPRQLGDVNGDGRADIIGFTGPSINVGLGQANGTFGTALTASTSFGGYSSFDASPRLVGDVNGDGRVDAIGFAPDGVYVALGQANGTFGATNRVLANAFGTGSGWASQNTAPRQITDVNGDNRADIVGFNASGVFVSLGQADGTFGAVAQISTAAYGGGDWTNQDVTPRLVADVNGDNLDDLVVFGTSGVTVSLASYRPDVGNDTLTGTAGNDWLAGLSGNDRLIGGAGNDVLDGGEGDDIVEGGDGADVYRFGRSGGKDTIRYVGVEAANSDRVEFGAAIGSTDLWFSRSGNNLVVSILGSTDSISVENWYSNANAKIERFQASDGMYLAATRVDDLVNAMAAFNPSNGSGGTGVQPGALPSSVQVAVNTTWIR